MEVKVTLEVFKKGYKIVDAGPLRAQKIKQAGVRHGCTDVCGLI